MCVLVEIVCVFNVFEKMCVKLKYQFDSSYLFLLISIDVSYIICSILIICNVSIIIICYPEGTILLCKSDRLARMNPHDPFPKFMCDNIIVGVTIHFYYVLDCVPLVCCTKIHFEKILIKKNYKCLKG